MVDWLCHPDRREVRGVLTGDSAVVSADKICGVIPIILSWGVRDMVVS